MPDTSTTGLGSVSMTGGQATIPGALGSTPPLLLSSQYVRDMTFHVPGAPGIYAAIQQMRPHVTLGLDVQVRPAQDNHPVYEVALLIRCSATTHPPVEGQDGPPVAFVVELAYCGIFTLQNVEQALVEPVLLAECPRLLFPFARNVLADITREAGFPPVMLQPIDFVAMWQARRATQPAQAAPSQTADAPAA